MRGPLVLLMLSLAGLAACRGPERAGGASEPEASEPAVASGPKPTPPPPISDDPVIQALVELAGVDSQVDDHLRVLAIDIGPRLTSSDELAEAEQWAEQQLDAWGLDARLEAWGSFPVGFERGPSRGSMIRPQRKSLEFGTWAWTPGTPKGEPRRGQVVRYPASANELAALRPYLKDAWILVPRDFAAPTGKLAEQIERTFDKASVAGLLYAAGAPDDSRIEFHGNHQIKWEELPERVEVYLRGDQHAELVELLGQSEFVQIELTIPNEFVRGPISLHNVIAELSGERRDEQVIVGAHLDSWDGASGAIDNATGVATTLEAARLLAAACAKTGQRPRRSLTFMLWSGEEQGLLGSKAWVEAHPEQLPGISAVLVHDGGTNYVSGIPATPEMWADMQQVLAPVLALTERAGVPAGDDKAFAFTLSPVESLPREPSDSTSFIDAGVPGFYWAQAGRSDYERYHHTQLDHADAVIDEYQRHSALVIAIAAWMLAQLDHQLERQNAFALPPRVLGVQLEGNVVQSVGNESEAAEAGISKGDRIVEIDSVATPDAVAVVAAVRAGGANKRVVVERPRSEGTIERLELSLDFRGREGEAEREARRKQRLERFPAELLPWEASSSAEDPSG